jgi:hypothetical protein
LCHQQQHQMQITSTSRKAGGSKACIYCLHPGRPHRQVSMTAAPATWQSSPASLLQPPTTSPSGASRWAEEPAAGVSCIRRRPPVRSAWSTSRRGCCSRGSSGRRGQEPRLLLSRRHRLVLLRRCLLLLVRGVLVAELLVDLGVAGLGAEALRARAQRVLPSPPAAAQPRRSSEHLRVPCPTTTWGVN